MHAIYIVDWSLHAVIFSNMLYNYRCRTGHAAKENIKFTLDWDQFMSIDYS